MRRAWLLLFSILLPAMQCGCGMRTVAPPAAPAPTMPDVGELPPDEGGLARVVVSTDVPARVERVTHNVANLSAPRTPTSAIGGVVVLCSETPCVVTLPYGDHELVFTGLRDTERTGRAVLVVRSATVVLNHTLGRVHTPRAQGIAWLLATTGALFLGTALAVAEYQQKQGPHAADATPRNLALSGLGMVFVGGIVGVASMGTQQEGASTQWTPAARAPGVTAGLSAGLRF